VLERASRLVDVPESRRHLLTLSVSHSKHSMGRLRFPTIQSSSWIAISMPFPAGLGHGGSP